MAELGLIGLLLYLFPVMWWFIRTAQAWKYIPKEGLWNRKLLAILWLLLSSIP